jgi:signal peptidase II
MVAPILDKSEKYQNPTCEQSVKGGLLIALIWGIFFLLLDQGSKWGARHFLAGGGSVDLIGSVVRLTLVYNTKLAFGIPLWIGIGAIVVLMAGLFLLKAIEKDKDSVQTKEPALASSLLSAGLVGVAVGAAMGNIIDRIVFGAVVDFIELPHWPVFNVADVGLTVVVIVFGWKVLGMMKR